MIAELKSHPHLFLNEHLAQINMALKQGILPWHSDDVITEEVKGILKKVISFHDSGKGTPAFQEYIKDPLHYQGNERDKAHTPLSLVIALTMAESKKWDDFVTLIVAAVIKGHHSRLPTIPEKKIGKIDCPKWDLDNFAYGQTARVLKKQLGVLDFVSLEKEIGLCFWDDIFKEVAPTNLINKAKNHLKQILKTRFWRLTIGEAVELRLKTQLIFSILLEADKAFLAVSDPTVYLKREKKRWKSEWVDQKIGVPPQNTINQLRRKARTEVMSSVENVRKEDFLKGEIFSLTAPTGIGKTLLAANWALKMREKAQDMLAVTSKIIVVLPFLSVIEQTAKNYEELLKIGGYKIDGSWLLKSHSLADRNYADWLNDEDEPFFVDSWRSELIITTYDQFLMNLMEPKARYQMRFHNLCDAIIIMDEVQSLPCQLWVPLEQIFKGLAKAGNSKILLMSATLPAFVKDAQPLLKDYQEYFQCFQRYEIHFRLKNKTYIKDFCAELCQLLPQWIENKKRVLITLNTRKSARIIRDALYEVCIKEHFNVPLLFLSADVTPKDRLDKIKTIKEGDPCIVVSTQCIEAGVDIDMDIVFRDFAPLDSLIQIAGRCNREWRTSNRKVVTVVDLVNEQGNRYSQMIYNPIHLQETRELLKEKDKILEEEILNLAEDYFASLAVKKDTGKKHLYSFAYWQEDISVREILRGPEIEQYTFLVLEEDPSLRETMIVANNIEDCWQRKEEWRKLASRIAMISVQIYAQKDFNPGWIAQPFLNNYWIVNEGCYQEESGLQISVEISSRIL